MKYFGTSLAFVLILVLSFHVQEDVAWLMLKFPRLVNPKSTSNPNRILVEVKNDSDSTDNPLVTIDFQKKTITWPLSEDIPINLTPPHKLTTNYCFNLTCDMDQMYWKVFSPNGSILINQKVPLNCSFWPHIRFACFVSERLNSAFLVFPRQKYSPDDLRSTHVLLRNFSQNTSKMINITQNDNEYFEMMVLWDMAGDAVKEMYDISDMPTIYDEEAIVTYLWNGCPEHEFYYRFSMDNGLEFLVERTVKASDELWNTQTKQLIILEGRVVHMIGYNSSHEIEKTNITFTANQLSFFLSKPLSFPPLQYLIIIPLLVILFKKTRKGS